MFISKTFYWFLLAFVFILLLYFYHGEWKYSNKPTTFMWGFIPENATSRNSKYTDLCQYYLNAAEEIFFRYICCPEKHGHFSTSIWSKWQLQKIPIEMFHHHFTCFIINMNYLLNLLKLKLQQICFAGWELNAELVLAVTIQKQNRIYLRSFS